MKYFGYNSASHSFGGGGAMLKELCIWLVVCIQIGFGLRYSYQVYRKRTEPTLSMWIIFQLGTALSLTTYMMSGKHDFRSGILNAMDTTSVAIALTATSLWGKRTIRFHRFEFIYLAIACSIVLYGVLSGDAFHSNLFTQGLITLGYFPSVQKMIKEKRNTESFSSWSIGLLAGLTGLVPAVLDHNTLSIVYAVRTIIMISAFMLLMLRYTHRP